MLNKTLKSFDISKYNILRFSGFMLSLPEIIVIEPTNYCNFSCLKCQKHYQTPNRKTGFLSINDLKLILSKIPNSINFIGVSGFGEPLIHPSFIEILKIIRLYKPNTAIGFHTNGVLLNKRIIDACIKYQVCDIEISIDSCDKETYKKLHTTKYSFNKLEYNILSLVSARDKSKSKLRIGTSYIIQQENIGQLAAFIKWSNDLGVDFVGPVKTINPLLGYNMDKWKNPFEDVKKEIIKAMVVSDRLRIEVQYPNIKETKAGSANISSLDWFSCAFPYDLYPIITWDGYAFPCVWIQDMRYNCGNLLQDSFSAIWNGKKIRKIRKTFAKGRYLKICKNCKPLCAGYQYN